MNVTMKVTKHRIMTKSYFAHLKKTENNNYRKTMAMTLCRQADLPTDRAMGITEIQQFEDLLDVNILVLSAKLGSQLCRVGNDICRKNIYLYLTEANNGSGPIDGFGSINVYFNYGYFCETFLKPYKNKGKHSCITSCDVCGRNDFPAVGNDPMSCRLCNARVEVSHVTKVTLPRPTNGAETSNNLCAIARTSVKS